MAKIKITAEGSHEFAAPRNVSAVRRSRMTAGFSASSDVPLTAQATYELVDVAIGVLISEVHSRVIAAFNSSVTITIGDGASAAGYLASADIAPQSAAANINISMLNLGGKAYGGGKYYSAVDTIDAVVAGATPTQGLLELLFDWTDFSSDGF